MSARVGKTRTFGISVDLETEQFLRDQAKLRFGGNVSKLVTALAREEQSRLAADWLLSRSKSYTRMDDDEVQDLVARLTAPKKKSKRRSAA